MKTDDVRILIEKFLSGESTLEEERMLDDFFKETADIPEELSAYKEMFSYFDSGMADGCLLTSDDEIQQATNGQENKRNKNIWLWKIAAAAAIVALIIVGAYNMAIPGNTNDGESVKSSMLAHKETVADSISARTDSTLPRERKEQVPKRRLKKWRFKPAPPETLLAEKEAISASDSISMASARMAESEIRKVEQEQQYIISLIGAMDIINSAEIASVADEVEVY